MKKQEVKWISRDLDGTYVVWKQKPKLSSNGFWYSDSIIQRDAEPWERLCVNLKHSGLAKVIVERKY